MIRHFTKRIPRDDRKILSRDTGIKLGIFATYADFLDKLREKGYCIELKPIYTFAFQERVAFLIKVYKREEDNARWVCIFDEETAEEYNEGYGGSFEYQIRYAAKKIKRDIGNGRN